MHHNGVVPSHADLRDVLIHSSLAVPNSRNILDDNHVVWFLPRTVQDIIGAHHVIHHIALGYLSVEQSNLVIRGKRFTVKKSSVAN